MALPEEAIPLDEAAQLKIRVNDALLRCLIFVISSIVSDWRANDAR